jgi:hypothetical protein
MTKGQGLARASRPLTATHAATTPPTAAKAITVDGWSTCASTPASAMAKPYDGLRSTLAAARTRD